MSIDLEKPETKKAVTDALKEYCDVMAKIQSEKDQAKEILGAIADLTSLEKKVVNKIAKHYYNQSLTQTENDFSELKDLYTKLLG